MAMRGDTTGAERNFLRDMLSVGADILEIGCGDGRLTRQYAGLARSVTGIDPGEAGLRDARLAVLNSNMRLARASGDGLPFQAASFDQALFALSL